MPYFTKKPITIQAEQISVLLDLSRNNWSALPEWVKDHYGKKNIKFYSSRIIVRTLEGEMTGNESDWLIHGVKGEVYPCAADVFYQSYTEGEGVQSLEIKELDFPEFNPEREALIHLKRVCIMQVAAIYLQGADTKSNPDAIKNAVRYARELMIEVEASEPPEDLFNPNR